jgi:hypothetical protein
VTERWRDRVTVLAAAVLAVLLLGPALGPGYSLVLDQVFVPDQDLLPWMAGIGGGLPRAVPQDTVVAVLSGPLPGWLLQSVALLAALVALGSGAGRLVRPAGRRAALAAAVFACWSPYVVERLQMGHWSLLLAVAMMPWALHHARDAREGTPGAGARWLLVVALASLTVSGGLLVLVVSLPVLLWTGGAGRGRRLLVAGAGLLLQLPWLVPALQHPTGEGPRGSGVFGLHPEGVLGPVLTGLSTGGVWNVFAVPGTRVSWLAPVLLVTMLLLAVVGRRTVVTVIGRPVAITLAVASTLGLVVAIGSAVAPDTLSWFVVHVPGAGVLRDAQKWVAPWLLLLSAAAGCGAARVSAAAGRRLGDATVAGTVLVALLVVPLVCLPDAAWGGLGRLATVDYPDDWAQARAALISDPARGDVVSLPWHAFRTFPWNLGRTVLDPAPRYMPRTVVSSTDLVILRPRAVGLAPVLTPEPVPAALVFTTNANVDVIPGDDPRATRIGAALDSQRDVDATLRREGIGWALVDGPAPTPVPFTGATLVVSGPDLSLYRLRPPEPVPAPTGVLVVVLGNLVALLILLGAVLTLARSRLRRGSDPDRAGTAATGW